MKFKVGDKIRFKRGLGYSEEYRCVIKRIGIDNRIWGYWKHRKNGLLFDGLLFTLISQIEFAENGIERAVRRLKEKESLRNIKGDVSVL